MQPDNCNLGLTWTFKLSHIFFSSDQGQKNKVLKEKQRAISEVVSEVQEKEMQKEDIIQKIGKLTEEQTKKKECKTVFIN